MIEQGASFLVESPSTYRERLDGSVWCKPGEVRIRSVTDGQADVVESGTNCAAIRTADVDALTSLVEDDILVPVE